MQTLPRFAYIFAPLLSIAMSVPIVEAAEQPLAGFYLGAGAGASRLAPDDGDSEFTLVDKEDSGRNLYIGRDVANRYGVELAVTQLGAAGFDPAGELRYRVGSLSGLYYPLQHAARTGLKPFVKAGVGKLENEGDVPFEQLNKLHVLFGAGIEYNLPVGFGARAELVTFDRDAQYGNLSLHYRFGGRSAPVDLTKELAPAPIVQTPDEEPPEPVTLPPLVLPVAYFDSNSVALNADALVGLQSLSEHMVADPSLVMVLVGHADKSGPAEYNLMLAQRRVVEVARYLVDRGVTVDQIEGYTKGEDSPAIDDESAEAYASNRRVMIYRQDELL